MASPFTLLGMARRATQNFRQMTYNAPTTPEAAPTPAATNDDNSDTVSIASKMGSRRRTSPLIAPTRKPSTAVVEAVTVMSPPPSSPPPSSPPAKSILSDVASNGSSTTLAQEPTSMLSESPKMGSIDLKGSNDYFSPRKSSGSSERAEIEALDNQAIKRLEEQVRSLTSQREKVAAELRSAAAEKERIAGELESATASAGRLEKELKDKREEWEADRAGLVMEKDEDKRRFEMEKDSLSEKVHDLMVENKALAEDRDAKQKQWDHERALLADEMTKEVEALEDENAQLGGRIASLETAIGEKEEESERLEGRVAALVKEKADGERTIATLRQYLSAAKDEAKQIQAQGGKDLDAAKLETRRVAQKAREDKVAWDAERQSLVKERAQEKQRLEGEKKQLSDRLSSVQNELGAKGMELKRSEDAHSAIVKEKEQASRMVKDLQLQVASKVEELEDLKASSAGRESALQKDIERIREERDRQLSLKDNYIHSLKASVDELKRELDQTRQSMKQIVAQNDETISQLTASLTERTRLVEETEREKTTLREHFLVLGDELEGKEQEKRALEQDIIELTQEKDQRGKTVASLQEQLTLAAEEMKILRDTSTAKTIGLEEELRRMREEQAQQGGCWIM
ncbi:hypothetical protein D9611_003564 [Ephemerocybe angulata]|uniref:Uncharacterized protein n=1 Tax=Ephemerocybe angulata TaxID=980116 RepID=A0A8H5B7C9_9AGAR|nr:hypothetical protein D9611_003564 [Tulosesus angulatus]